MKKIFKLNVNKSKLAFTLAEVLITLVVIGVVAAITVPILHNSTNDKEYVVGMQKARATIGEAFRLMTVNGEIDKDKSTEEFVQQVITKYLKLAKTCGEGENAAKNCGFPSNIKRFNGESLQLSEIPMSWEESTYAAVTDEPTKNSGWGTLMNYNTKYPGHNESYFFKTLDGFSVNFFYNPYCVNNSNEQVRLIIGERKAQQVMDTVCFNAVYDMNGAKGPNAIGKDIGFVGSFYNGYEAKIASVLPYDKEVQEQSLDGSTDRFSVSLNYCRNLDNNNSWILPDISELSLLYLNNQLLRGTKSVEKWYWSRTPLPGTDYFGYILFHSTLGGARFWYSRDTSFDDTYIMCVRNNTLK